jgi:hypothetical protein
MVKVFTQVYQLAQGKRGWGGPRSEAERGEGPRSAFPEGEINDCYGSCRLCSERGPVATTHQRTRLVALRRKPPYYYWELGASAEGTVTCRRSSRAPTPSRLRRRRERWYSLAKPTRGAIVLSGSDVVTSR